MPKKSQKKTEKKEKKKIESKKLSDKEFEKAVLDLAKQDLTAEKIGEKLRSQGIHPQEHSIKISRILKQNNVYVQPDIKNIQAKLKKIVEHFAKNPQDKKSKREKDRVFSQLRKVNIYHKKI